MTDHNIVIALTGIITELAQENSKLQSKLNNVMFSAHQVVNFTTHPASSNSIDNARKSAENIIAELNRK